MGKPYKTRRAINSAIDGARMAHRALSDCLRYGNDGVAYVCAALIRILTPIIGVLAVAIIVSIII